MRRLAASVIAMTAGWMVMNVLVLGLDLGWKIVQGQPIHLRAVFSNGLMWLGATAIVVAGAALLVYLPVYAAVPRVSVFWKWRVCVPVGVVAGAAAGFGMVAAMEGFPNGWTLARVATPAAAIVGGVAAVAGRYLLDWSRHYREVGPYETQPRDSHP